MELLHRNDKNQIKFEDSSNYIVYNSKVFTLAKRLNLNYQAFHKKSNKITKHQTEKSVKDENNTDQNDDDEISNTIDKLEQTKNKTTYRKDRNPSIRLKR